MRDHQSSLFERTVVKSRHWTDQIQELGHLTSSQPAIAAMRAVMHTLRDSLPLEEAVQLSAQMPTLIRGIYFENWRPGAEHRRVRRWEDFLDAVRRDLADDFRDGAELLTRAVFQVMERNISRGEMNDVLADLPESVRFHITRDPQRAPASYEPYAYD